MCEEVLKPKPKLCQLFGCTASEHTHMETSARDQ